MPLTNAQVVQQIDNVLAQYEQVVKTYTQHYSDPYIGSGSGIVAPTDVAATTLAALTTALTRLGPKGVDYATPALEAIPETQFIPFREYPVGQRMQALAGALRQLRDDYRTDRIRSYKELLHAELFSDFLEMAEHLLNEGGYKDPAAVLAGGVLEEHVRKLCDKHSIATTVTDTKGDVKPKKLNSMNADLAGGNVYSKNEQQQVLAWAAIRNSAAHAKWTEYTQEEVALMVQGIRHFIARYPA